MISLSWNWLPQVCACCQIGQHAKCKPRTETSTCMCVAVAVAPSGPRSLTKMNPISCEFHAERENVGYDNVAQNIVKPTAT